MPPVASTPWTPLRFGETEYRACDGCESAIRIVPVLSGNAIGGTLWSDGYLEAPQLPERPVLARCSCCEAIVCLQDLAPLPPPAGNGEKDSFDLLPLTLRDFEWLLANLEHVSDTYHGYLRIRYWQLGNDDRRAAEEPAPLTKAERQNLLALLDVLGPEDANRLMKAEIYRELAEFERADQMLEGPFGDEVDWIAKRIRALVRRRDHRLVKIPLGEKA